MNNFVEVGEKLHVATRRAFKEDLQRHFAGEVTRVLGDLVRANGYTFVFDPQTYEYRRRPELRTRIFDLGDGMHIVNVLPKTVTISALTYEMRQGRLVISDRSAFALDLSEFGVCAWAR